MVLVADFFDEVFHCVHIMHTFTEEEVNDGTARILGLKVILQFQNFKNVVQYIIMF